MSLVAPLALVLLLPPLAFMVWVAWRPGGLRGGVGGSLPGDWGRLVAPALRRFMSAGAVLGSPLALVLLLVLWVLLVLSLSRPGIELESRADFSNIAGRVIALDLGAGADIHAQRGAVLDLLAAMPRIPTALVVATGDAFDAVPLTTDRAFLERYLNVIEPDVMPLEGRSLPVMLAHAEAVLTRSGIVAGQVVLVTGGAPPAPGAEQPARFIRAVVVVDADGDAWADYARRIDARMAGHDGLGAVNRELEVAVERAIREGDRESRFELGPLLLALAVALWLGLFRRQRGG